MRLWVSACELLSPVWPTRCPPAVTCHAEACVLPHGTHSMAAPKVFPGPSWEEGACLAGRACGQTPSLDAHIVLGQSLARGRVLSLL